MSTPCQREAQPGEGVGFVINVAGWATSPTSAEVPVPEVDGQTIDNATPKIIALYVGKSDISRENAAFGSSPLPRANRVRETIKGRPITRPGVRPR